MVPALRDECGDDFVGRFCMLATVVLDVWDSELELFEPKE